MTRLSVNINKVATLRNARGGDVPNVVKVALDCEAFGADGITVHPRPDERHIRMADVYDLRPLLRTEFNIEGYPSPEFIDLVLKVKPHQADRVELYTEPYATAFSKDPEAAVAPFVEAAKVARKLGIGLNAGHDLSLVNLNFFYKNIPWLDEVSIGHALISDALYLGLERTIQEYKNCLR